MIPGFIIAWITFPGVIVHELAHALFCRWFGLKLYEVKYFQFATFGQPSGYVIHERSKNPMQDMLVAIGPFFVNTILGAVIGAPAAIPVLRFHAGDPLDYFLMWLGVSVAMHSFPSTGDAKSIWHSVTSREVSIPAKIVCFPIIGLIYLGALGSVFWLDAIYGLAIAGALPNLLVKLLA